MHSQTFIVYFETLLSVSARPTLMFAASPVWAGADGLSHCSVLAKESAEVAEELIQLKAVHGLMVAVGNLDHVASQRHASSSLEVSMVVHGSGHHSMGSAPTVPEQKGSLHHVWFFFSLSIADRLIHKGRSDTSFRKELCFPSSLPPCWHSQGSTPRLAVSSKHRQS